jgi:hypothetical protein
MSCFPYYTGLNDDVLVLGFVAGGVGIGVKVHIRGDGMTRDKARQRPDLREDSHFVHLKA